MQQNVSQCVGFQMALLPYMYGVEFIVALTGNAFALWLLMVRERRNWHSGVVLSCNLAISDLLYVLTLPLLIVYYSMEKNWIFGNFVCKIERFLFTCNLYVSIFFIMAISVNRCVALACPFFTRSYVEPVHIKIISIVIWIVVGVMSCPVLNFASVCPSIETNHTLCVSFCDISQAPGHLFYKLFLAVFGCLIPFIVTFTSYCVVIRVVWRNVSITTLEKRKVAILVASVLVLYAFSFLPYHCFQLYNFYLRTKSLIITSEFECFIHIMYQVCKGMANMNMCVHPILYMALVDSIRVACCGKRLEDNSSKGMRK